MPSPSVLSPEQSDALRNVDLRFFFGRHGLAERQPDQGRMALGVTDYDYHRIATAIEGLDPSRGDELAMEGKGEFSYRIGAYSVFEYLQETAYDSAYVDSRPLISFHPTRLQQAERLTDYWHYDPQAATEVLADLRRYRVITPFAYGLGLAALKGIKSSYADATHEEITEWRKEKQQTSLLGSLSLTENIIKIELRNRKILQRLGTIAMEMQSPASDRKPVLLDGLGARHRRSMYYLLDKHNIPFSSVNTIGDVLHSGVQSANNLLNPRTMHQRWTSHARKQAKQDRRRHS